MFRLVKGCVDAWDPCDLLGTGAPADEFDSESRMIAGMIRPDSTEREIALAVSHVFSRMFDDDSFSPENCRNVAAAIASRLRERSE